jgi:hypothetical protein
MADSQVADRRGKCSRDLQLRLLALCLDRPRTLSQLLEETQGEACAVAATLERAVADGVVRLDGEAGAKGHYVIGSGPMREMVAMLLMLDHETRPDRTRTPTGNGEAA